MSDVETQLEDVQTRLDALEARMTFLLRRLDIAAEQPSAVNASPAVLDLLSRRDKAGAIRAYMDEAPCSLKDAKRYLESLRL